MQQGAALYPYLFSVVMNKFTKEIERKDPWCMLFIDDILTLVENREELN